jgi:hypothetical protein
MILMPAKENRCILIKLAQGLKFSALAALKRLPRMTMPNWKAKSKCECNLAMSLNQIAQLSYKDVTREPKSK